MKSNRTEFLLATLAMSLGWGLRGTIGGGEFGAMIPGAMLGLVLSQILGYSRTDTASITIGAALGFGLGGSETYGQTIGLLRDWRTSNWGMLGLFLKGSQWGLGAAVYIWVARLNSVGKLKSSQMATVLAIILSGQLIGWWFVNHPRLLYFSDPLNKPREEVWFGLHLGPLLGMVYLMQFTDRKSLCKFVFGGCASGALGFGLGSIWLLIGLHLPEPYNKGPWWKCMEFSFGAILGAGFYWIRCYLPASSTMLSDEKKSKPNPFDFAIALLIVAGSLAFQFLTPHRLPFQFLAPLLMLIGTMFPPLTWHVSLSLTIFGYFYDLFDELLKAKLALEMQALLPVVGCLVVLIVHWLTTKEKLPMPAIFLLLTHGGMAVWLAGMLLLHREGVVVPAIFILESIAVTILSLRLKEVEIPLVPFD